MAISDGAVAGAVRDAPDLGEAVDERALGFVPDRARRYTADEVRALNAANPRWWPRYECAGGELLVTPSPEFGHQSVAQDLMAELQAYVRRALPGALAMLSPADISWGGRHESYVQPDVFVLAPDVVSAVRRTGDWRDVTQLLLAVEVLSPGSVTHDRVIKRDLYLAMGVPTYWVVDPGARHVEVWTPGATEAVVERFAATWQPEGAGEPFVLDVPGLFAAP